MNFIGNLVFAIMTLVVMSCFYQTIDGATLTCMSSASSSSSVGKYWGESQECVAGVKYFCKWASVSSASFTTGAKRGKKVLGNCANISKHTAIATFENAGKYQGHAAVFISCDSAKKTINVYDQWSGRPWNARLISNVNGGASNNPTKFYVVEY
jgi:hypothetical protein